MQKSGETFSYISLLCVTLAWLPAVLFYTGWDVRGVILNILTPSLLLISFVFGLLGIFRSYDKKFLSFISVIFSVITSVLYLTVLVVSGMGSS
ncbi:hypothetical protein [Aquisalibacillus elongatus]|uniref:Uncharacterized protein n=1 Tax=Aquisalibacillus elongatus TaxID=485577 RepID=A0A3N5BCX9_9BACI|nr:hypothetical protein [Aquisalibacillus elongatus]RPF55494.1 hypothetical protein EDC24_0372 [Aquisalibacillus elongatus]